jgi:hypothetical protein
MRGHVAKKGTRWYPVVEQRDPATGDRKRKWHPGHSTKKEAQRALTDILSRMDGGSYVEPSKLTVETFLTGQWLPAIEATIRPSTLFSYRGHVRRHLIPALGAVPLQKLNPSAINGLYASLAARGLSAATIRRVHATLHRALKDALRWQLIPRNPADASDPPRATAGKAEEMATWSPSELKAFLGHVRDGRLYAAWMLAAGTGMRRRWSRRARRSRGCSTCCGSRAGSGSRGGSAASGCGTSSSAACPTAARRPPARRTSTTTPPSARRCCALCGCSASRAQGT